MAAFIAAGCGSGAVNQVAEGTYLSLVPSVDQVSLDVPGALPGGVAHLSEQGIDREGSGPFKAEKQVLVLGDAPLVLGGLIIDEPVIWPGSFEDSPVITIKRRNPDERGPSVSCRADEPCLVLSSGVDPGGRYADASNPELGENPIDSILIGAESIGFTFDSGENVTISAGNGAFTRACGLSENRVWDLPAELGLAIDNPVLIHTLCPSTPGAAIQLVIMDRSAIPVLAPVTEVGEGDWCTPGPKCLLFVPT